MKHQHLLIATVIALGLAVSIPARADVSVSIHVGEPTFFGRIDVFGAPPPLLIRSKPIIIEPPAVRIDVEPLYLRVRPEESRNWRRYCRRYDACGRPVYFVKDRWYRNVYVPHYHSHHEDFERREHERMERDRAERQRWQEHHDDDHANHDRHEHREEQREERHEERREDRRHRHNDHDHDHDHDHDRDEIHDHDHN